jgi:hypothetical protein
VQPLQYSQCCSAEIGMNWSSSNMAAVVSSHFQISKLMPPSSCTMLSISS